MHDSPNIDSDQPYDIVIIGAGIHGAGIAEVAALQGWRTLLLEKDHPAAGTSSRSSKLIHGGLRYLETFQWSLVRHSLRDRDRLLKTQPDLVKLVPFFIPIYADSRRSRWQIVAGLSLYALLGGLRKTTRFRRVPRSDWDQLDGLKTNGLRAVFQYLDGQTDDRRLTEVVVQNAQSHSAEFVCPADFLKAERRDSDYVVHWHFDGETRSCRTKTLVNAAGPWVNDVHLRIQPMPTTIDIDLVQGTHLVLDTSISAGIFYAESPQDRRPVFVMPWHGRTLVGTTESPFDGAPDNVHPLQDEEEYLLNVFRHYFPQRSTEVVERFAGLRVLPKSRGSFNRRSRETILLPDNPTNPRGIAVYGGKLTTFHSTAIDVLNLLAPALFRS
ncbi:MAG: glycerol-3-phosphate dehydrogenase/oxidase [Planctomycetota bacterium]|nr:glycerol-3-phosphate dehydrogenase/oxidase [Planctomycetota bacterium]